MKRPITLIVTMLLVSTPAHAKFDETVATAICKTVKSQEEDVRVAYTDAFFTTNPIPLTWSEIGTADSDFDSVEKLTERIVKCFKNSKTKCQSVRKVAEKLEEQITQIFREDDPYFESPNFPRLSNIERAGQGGLRSFLSRDNGGVTELRCRSRFLREIRSAEENQQTHLDRYAFVPRLAISKNADSVGLDDPDITSFKSREAAQFAITLDRENKINTADPGQTAVFVENEVFQADMAVSLDKFFRIHRGELEIESRGDETHDIYISPYAALQYKTNLDNTKETDNLSFGLKLNQSLPESFKIPLNISGILSASTEVDGYSVNLAYVTDIEQRESRQWFAEAKTEFVTAEFLNIPNVQTFLGLTAVMDYSQVDEFVDKVKLKDINEFLRLGYDLSASAAYNLTDGLRLGLDVNYQFRDTLTNEAANADHVTASLNFKPVSRPDLELSYGIVYERGETLISLEDVEIRKLAIGLKR